MQKKKKNWNFPQCFTFTGRLSVFQETTSDGLMKSFAWNSKGLDDQLVRPYFMEIFIISRYLFLLKSVKNVKYDTWRL